ncbi:hypothetical protein [Pseudomonas sp. KNUC1026]|uniref:hypothetical protein n=1 Tax=Pseudomonas sp. KNUC1026 TaxID=2893890 RepID=UPI001F46DEF2|nr:hypothetical protein [Pseudomonas sp. KNUC1026]UFH50950.1 hypothetical protein LN139_07685 [Pseudomonas sp. KNUC1026]
MAPKQDAPLNLKLFKLRSEGRETLVHDTVVHGCKVVACEVEPGARYRLYGFSSQTGPLQPMDVELPQARQWATGAPLALDEPLPASTHGVEQPDAQLHLMLRPDRVQRCPRFDQLRAGECFTPVFNLGHLPAGSAHGSGVQRFTGLLRLQGARGSKRLQELALALEERADVAYCSLDPTRPPWSDLGLASLVGRIRPGAVLAMPWRYPLADAGCAPIAHSRVMWDIQRACFETDATVFYSGKPEDAASPVGARPVQWRCRRPAARRWRPWLSRSPRLSDVSACATRAVTCHLRWCATVSMSTSPRGLTAWRPSKRQSATQVPLVHERAGH